MYLDHDRRVRVDGHVMQRNVAGSCNSGQAQSPIDIMTTEVVPVDAEDATMGPVQVKWGTLASFNIKNNGHTVQA
jgi:carbonic anhydrase